MARVPFWSRIRAMASNDSLADVQQAGSMTTAPDWHKHANADEDLNTEPRWASTEGLWGKMRPLLERLLAAPRAPRTNSAIPARPGIYLFSDGERFRYVGQTRNLRERLGQHTRPSGTHYSATLAFIMASNEAASKGMDMKRRRADLQDNPEFAECFTRAKATVAGWKVQVVEEGDPNVRTVFEVYVHLALGTDLNRFETH